MTSLPQIETERLRLTLPSPARAESVAAYYRLNAAHLKPWSPARPADFLTRAFWERRLGEQRSLALQGRAYCFVIELNDDDAPEPVVVGNCELTQVARGPFQACHLGFSLAAVLEGQGYMREALTGALRFAFDDLALHRVMAAYRPHNQRSGRLLKRLGFVVEGYARDYLLIDGAWRDHILTARVASEL